MFNLILWAAKLSVFFLLVYPPHEAVAQCITNVHADFKKENTVSYRTIVEMAIKEDLSFSEIQARVGQYFRRESYSECRRQIRQETEFFNKSKSLNSCSIDRLGQNKLLPKDVYTVFRSALNRYAGYTDSAAAVINECMQEMYRLDLKSTCTRKKWGEIEGTLTDEFLANSSVLQESEILSLKAAQSSDKLKEIGPMLQSFYRDCLTSKSDYLFDKRNYERYLLASKFWFNSQKRIAQVVQQSKARGSPYESKFGDTRYELKSMRSEPFNSIVRVKEQASGGGDCSGAFVNDLRTVVTSAHCFNKWGNTSDPSSATIKITDETGSVVEEVPAKLVAVGNSDPEASMKPGLRLTGKTEDWAVLRLERVPNSTHLKPLAPPMNDYKYSTVPVGIDGFLALGYPAEWPKNAPIMAHLGAIKKGDYIFSDFPVESIKNHNGVRSLIFYNYSNLSGGASGGPLVFWDDDARIFRLAGVYSSSNKSEPDHTRLREAQATRSKLAVLGQYEGIFGKIELRQYDAGLTINSVAQHVMSSSLLCAVFKNSSNLSVDCNLAAVPNFKSEIEDY